MQNQWNSVIHMACSDVKKNPKNNKIIHPAGYWIFYSFCTFIVLWIFYSHIHSACVSEFPIERTDNVSTMFGHRNKIWFQFVLCTVRVLKMLQQKIGNLCSCYIHRCFLLSRQRETIYISLQLLVNTKQHNKSEINIRKVTFGILCQWDLCTSNS